MTANSFFIRPPQNSSDIRLTDENGFLRNPVTDGNTWFHSSRDHDTIFSDEYLDSHSAFLGTYHTCDPRETLHNGFLHENHIIMSHPLVTSNHHDYGQHGQNMPRGGVTRGQFSDIAHLVEHYAYKYGGRILPQYGDPSAPGAEERFYAEQEARNNARIKSWKDQCDRILQSRDSDPWNVQENVYLPSKPRLDTAQFSSNYLENFTNLQRLHIVRRGLSLEGYDGAVFHYSSGNPTIFVLRPTEQIRSKRVVKENTKEYDTVLRENEVKRTNVGLGPFIRKNDLFQAELARGIDSRAGVE